MRTRPRVRVAALDGELSELEQPRCSTRTSRAAPPCRSLRRRRVAAMRSRRSTALERRSRCRGRAFPAAVPAPRRDRGRRATLARDARRRRRRPRRSHDRGDAQRRRAAASARRSKPRRQRQPAAVRSSRAAPPPTSRSGRRAGVARTPAADRGTVFLNRRHGPRRAPGTAIVRTVRQPVTSRLTRALR